MFVCQNNVACCRFGRQTLLGVTNSVEGGASTGEKGNIPFCFVESIVALGIL